MVGRSKEQDVPVVVGAALDRRATFAAIAVFLVPIAAWIASLGLSYVVQDFGCSAAASAGLPRPVAGVFTTVLVLNIVLLVLDLAAGVAGLLVLRRTRRAEGRPVLAFLALSGSVLAFFVAFSIVLIGMMPFIFEVCR